MIIKNALWVGGPPGKTMGNIQCNLKKVGIKVIAKWKPDARFIHSKTKLPKDIDVVLINHEMCSHAAHDHVKDLCKSEFKRFILAHTNVSKTVQELIAKGVIQPDQPVFAETVTVNPRGVGPEVETNVVPPVTPEKSGLLATIWEGDKGIVYAKQRSSNGKMRRVRPVVVGTALFMSAVDAAKFLEIDNKKLSALLLRKTATEVNGFLCCYPDMAMAKQMLDSVIQSNPNPPLFSDHVKLIDEAVDAMVEIRATKDPKSLSPVDDSTIEQWRTDTRKLRKRYEEERERFVKRIAEIDHILKDILPSG